MYMYAPMDIVLSHAVSCNMQYMYTCSHVVKVHVNVVISILYGFTYLQTTLIHACCLATYNTYILSVCFSSVHHVHVSFHWCKYPVKYIHSKYIVYTQTTSLHVYTYTVELSKRTPRNLCKQDTFICPKCCICVLNNLCIKDTSLFRTL